ncbi:unnamed protein product, partial [Clonostachys rosea f. rosea IK726]
MTTDALEHIKSNKPLSITAARAHIGYLVGYRGSHQYLIWVPSKGRVKVIVSANVTFNEAVTYDPAREEEALTSAVRDDQVLTDLAAEDLGVSTEGYLQDIGLDLGSSNESQNLEPAVQGQIRQNDLYSEERLQGIDKIGSEGQEDHEDQYYPTPAPSRAATLDPTEQSDRLGFAVRETLEAIPDDPDEHEEEEQSSDEIIVDLPDDHPLALSNIGLSRLSRLSSGSRNTDESYESRESGSQGPDNTRSRASDRGSELPSLTHGHDESDRNTTDAPIVIVMIVINPTRRKVREEGQGDQPGSPRD